MKDQDKLLNFLSKKGYKETKHLGKRGRQWGPEGASLSPLSLAFLGRPGHSRFSDTLSCLQ